MNKVSTIIQEI